MHFGGPSAGTSSVSLANCLQDPAVHLDFQCSAVLCLVRIFPYFSQLERIYLCVLKLGSMLLVSWWPKHLPTYVALAIGKRTAGLTFPGLLPAMLRAVSHQDGTGPWFGKPAWSSPLHKRGIPIEVQFWAYRSVPGRLPCSAGGMILV